ncbi:MAG: mechanosensitive ion channel family protein [Candidatus Azobacteroides sp.]|nr:mechanosensitive ion channel family protein [Candidatus Azobacteroides sp.]
MNKFCIIRFLLICSIFLCLFAAAWGQSDSLAVSGFVRKTYAPVPVAPFNDTLFFINAGLGSFSPEERAASITKKIQNISKERDGLHVDSLDIITEGNVIEIVCRDIVVMTITETDAKLKGKTQLDLADEYKQIIRDAIVQYYKDTGWLTILWRIFLILLIIVVQYFLIRIVNRLFRWISGKVYQLKGRKIITLRIKSYKLLDEEKIAKSILFVFRILRYIIIFLMLYLSLLLAFSVFPSTQNIANALFSYVLKPFKAIFSGIIRFIPNLITIVVIVLVFRYLIKGLRFLTEEISKGRLTLKGFYPDWAHPTFSIIRTLLYVFMFIVIFPYLPGSESKVFQGVSVFIGIIFSLGSSSVISNVVSGLVLTYMRPFKVGDRIKIGDLIGNVIEKTPFVTRIRTLKNEEVTIPNSGIMSAQTFNYSHSARTYGLILHTKLTSGYNTPWRQIHELLLTAATRTPDVLKTPKPFVLQTALDDFYVEYQLNVYVNDADKMTQIYSALHQNIQDVFNEAGVEIMSPHYQAYRDGNPIAIPNMLG